MRILLPRNIRFNGYELPRLVMREWFSIDCVQVKGRNYVAFGHFFYDLKIAKINPSSFFCYHFVIQLFFHTNKDNTNNIKKVIPGCKLFTAQSSAQSQYDYHQS